MIPVILAIIILFLISCNKCIRGRREPFLEKDLYKRQMGLSNLEYFDEKEKGNIVLYDDVDFTGDTTKVEIGERIVIGKIKFTGDVILYYNSLEIPTGNFLIFSKEKKGLNDNSKGINQRFFVLHKNIPILEKFLVVNDIVTYGENLDNNIYLQVVNEDDFTEKKKKFKLNYISHKNDCVEYNKSFGWNMNKINDVCDLNINK